MPLLYGIRRRYWFWLFLMQEKMSFLTFRLAHQGKDRLCSVCGWRGSRFYPLGTFPDTKCPVCLSLPRHRLLKLVLEDMGLPKMGDRVLHVSPKGEERLGKWIRLCSSWYLSIDKGGHWNSFAYAKAMKQMDLTDLELPDGSVDFVCCSNVLENIKDDQKAISEIYRVLAPGGVAALQVQMYGDVTTRVDNPTPEDYWHVWHPGKDYFRRYEKVGFHVQVYEKHKYDIVLYGINNDVQVPLCWKD